MWTGKYLKEARLKAQLDQKALAEKVDIHPMTISRYETGEREPRISDLQKIATVLNTSVAYLVGETNDESLQGDAMFATKLRSLRKKSKLTQEELSQKVNVSIDTVRRWEGGARLPNSDSLRLIADIFDVSTDYLLERTESAKKEALQVFDNQVVVPIYNSISAHCGEGVDNHDITGELEQYLPLPSDYLGTKDASSVYGLHVDGNSMEAARIADGDIAVIRKCDDWFSPNYGDPCHVQYERDGYMVDAIKFYYPKKDGSSVTLSSAEGSGVRDMTFSHEDIARGNPNILGVVVGVVEFHKPIKGR